jgi:hypothetical protein
MAKNPFGDDPIEKPINPFGEEDDTPPVEDAANRLEHSARKIRLLRAQIGAEGLSPSGSRELLDEIARALEHAARGLNALQDEQQK